MNDRSQKRPISSITFGLLRNLTLISTGGMVLLALLLGIGVWQSGTRFFEGLQAIFNAPQPKPQVDVRSLIVHQVRSVSELTTAVFTMEAVVPTRQERKLGGYTVGSTTLLYIAYGEVRAGVNLADLDANDVTTVGDTIQLQLPPPRLLDSKIDVNRSQVYDYDRGFLNLGPGYSAAVADDRATRNAQKIVAAACSNGVLEEANDRAQLAVSKLLNTAGYKAVEVKTQTPPPGTCVAPSSNPPSTTVSPLPQ